MYSFISQSRNKKEKRKQIEKQSRLGFWGYFLKKMFRNGLTYNQGRYVDKKKALEVITPRQNLFLLVRTNHVDECIPLLKEIYGNIPAEYLQIPGLKDVNCCIKFGDIYVTEEDSDVSMKDPGFFSRFRMNRKYNIYLPPKYTSAQLEELNKVINVREDFKKWFFKDEIVVSHYKDYQMKDIEIYEGEDALNFIKDEYEKKDNENVDDTIEQPHENFIVEKQPNASFVDKKEVGLIRHTSEISSTEHLPDGQVR